MTGHVFLGRVGGGGGACWSLPIDHPACYTVSFLHDEIKIFRRVCNT